jgi:hypothetical protein
LTKCDLAYVIVAISFFAYLIGYPLITLFFVYPLTALPLHEASFPLLIFDFFYYGLGIPLWILCIIILLAYLTE